MTGSEIREARQAVGMTQVEMSFISGVPINYISLIEEETRLARYYAAMEAAVVTKQRNPRKATRRFPKRKEAIAA